MSTAELAREFAVEGIIVQVFEERLVMDAPPGALTPQRYAAVDALKAQIVALAASGGWTNDPRLDLAADSARWHRLLTFAYARDGAAPNGLFGALHGLRCCGAQLVTGKSGVRLVRGELSADEYATFRVTYLLPQANALRELLRMVNPQGEGTDVAGETPWITAGSPVDKSR